MIKIKNYQAGSIFEVDLGVRNYYDTKDAVLSDSLFLDHMPNLTSRDIICLDFKYGSRSYEEELKNITKSGKKFRQEKKLAYASGDKKRIEQASQYAEHLNYMYQRIKLDKDKFVKKSKEDLRILYYENGVTIKYPRFHGGVDEIHYQMLFRSPGKAKKGSCLFIRSGLYNKAREWLNMGIKLPEQNAPIVEIGAYSSLTTSSIVDKIHIHPDEILVIKDFDSFLTTNVVSVECDENKHCIAKRLNDYQIANTLFDGQALIDESIFPYWADGFILLRHHFCKMAAFNSRIQVFFKDYFGDTYPTAEVTDMWGRKIPARNIKLITTDNAMKWLKFRGVTFEYWSKWVKENGCQFGIVKTAHPSKLGAVQRMSYQMVNALSEETIDNAFETTEEYVNKLKTDTDEFLRYLDRAKNFSNDYEVLYELCRRIPEFTRCDYFRERKSFIIKSYVQNVRTGRIIQNADNLTICGSPYAMLLSAVGESPENDPTFQTEVNAVQVCTSRFKDGEYLAAFRNPYNSRNNMNYLHNIRHPLLDKYFDFGNLCIMVNMVHTDFQNRNNGSD